jgi:hypothetical protein
MEICDFLRFFQLKRHLSWKNLLYVHFVTIVSLFFWNIREIQLLLVYDKAGQILQPFLGTWSKANIDLKRLSPVVCTFT